ncbi:PREDICTED: TM2 domain-containing protein 3 isoform X2 [Hipposideros armiger]|uniref:TM2 domain-containing protein 3 isoform X2 n=1 Tax=Hipposideros armiger TaxID=186990 RepID=A0A8B7R0B6_HIPAR|nr:PREDICTED: TM2 domain-containing protein 3 isoform X2 [Hipposideros armiger]
MAAAAGPLRELCRFCRVLLFLSQFYVLSGGGSLNLEHSQPLAQSIRDPGPTRTFTVVPRAAESTDIPPYVMKCPSNGLCSRLPADCVECKTNFSCVYGKPATFDCTVKPSITCVDQDLKYQKSFVINMTCRFCWQLPETDYECSNSTSCMAVSCPRQRYTANCTVRDHVHCLGNRTFPKMLYCNWTGGYKWSTALALRQAGLWPQTDGDLGLRCACGHHTRRGAAGLSVPADSQRNPHLLKPPQPKAARITVAWTDVNIGV